MSLIYINPYTFGGIVTDSLQFHLDAGNTASYPGSGTTWTDLSGNGRNGTLTPAISGPTYTPSNGGAIVFDGFGDVVTCGTSAFPSGDISVFSWVYLTSFQLEWNIICTKWFNPAASDFHYALKSNLANGTNIRQNLYTTSNADIYGTSTYSTNTWYQIGFTLVNGGTLTFYKNGATDGTSASVSRTPGSSTLQVSDDRISGVGFSIFGRIPQITIYSKALSASEVTQNFDALRGRYGL